MSERHDWLNLIEVSGPFLSIPVLDEAFPQGLEGRDKRDAARLRQAYDEWREAVDVDDPSLDELHRAWVDEVLATALQMSDRDLRRGDKVGDALHVSLPEHGVTLTPDIVLVNVNDTEKPLLPIFVQPPNAPLDEVVHRDGWAASSAERMVQYLRGVDFPIGLVTNGERWMLVHAPAGQVTSFVSWYARLWSQEPETLRAFVSLLAVPRFYGPEEGQLLSLFARSEKHQDEVTEALGDQVRTAVEVLVQAIDKANQDRNGKLLAGVTPQDLYESGLTVMMRLVFILSAEERGLLLLGNTTYDNHYALSTFRQRLRRVSSNAHELLERRHAGWSRLLALFRAIYGGIEHSDLRLPAMGGSLFDPDRYPFLEGRSTDSNWLTDAADPLPIDDRTVLLMLDAIQSFEGRTLSYRALDVEQIGHVYEGLLERTVRQIDEVTLELRGSSKIKSPKVTLRELAEAGLDGHEALIELLEERTGRSVSALRNDLQRSRDDRLSAALLTACRGEVDLHDRVEPYVHLMALDPWDHPRLYHPGAYAVVLGSDRRETGTHYTPKSLTEKIVHETLTPVAYVGPAEGKPKEKWRLKSPTELLDLKICDPAMGSGAFLVQACRWLGERLVEAWSQAEASGGVISIDGEVLENAGESELLTQDAEERIVIARRLVAERCLYGVDMNPLAVELAKLSIWLVTLAEGRPFGFLDHNLRCGDSLLGIHRLDQLTELSMKPTRKGQQRLFGQTVERAVHEAIELRKRLRAMPIRDIHDVEAMAIMDAEARRKLSVPEIIAGAFITEIYPSAGNDKAVESRLALLSIQAGQAIDGDRDVIAIMDQRIVSELASDMPENKCLRQPFHWPLEFPEVFLGEMHGFHAVVSNPPFLGGLRITELNGPKYGDYLAEYIGGNNKVDLCAFFLKRAFDLIGHNCFMGMLATNTISQGVTRKYGLSDLLSLKASIFKAYPNFSWPGSASVYATVVYITKGCWFGFRELGKKRVDFIDDFLMDGDAEKVNPSKLPCNKNICFQGVNPLGKGFFISPEVAEFFIREDHKNSHVVKPVLGGRELNKLIDYTYTKWIISFGEMGFEEASKYQLPFEHVDKYVKPKRMEKDEAKYPRMVREWWKFWHARNGLYDGIKKKGLERVLVRARVSDYHIMQFLPADIVCTEQLAVFLFSGWGEFAILQSSFHDAWSRLSASSLGNGMRYIPGDCFETFPMMEPTSELIALGEKYWECREILSRMWGLGLYDIYKMFHDPDCDSGEILKLRRLQSKVDKAVGDLYGIDSLDLQHGFHNVALTGEHKIRFTISELMRRNVLSELTKINYFFYKKEVSDSLYGNEKSTRLLQKEREGISEASTFSEVSQVGMDFHLSSESNKINKKACSFSVLDFLMKNHNWFSKSDIIFYTEVDYNNWSKVIKDLIDRGLIERQGARRGTRYRAVRKDP